MRGSIVEDCEGAAVECAARHRRGAVEMVVDRGSIVEIQPEYLFPCLLVHHCTRLELGMIAVLGQDIFCPVRRRDDRTTLGPRKTLIPSENRNGD